MDCNKKGTREYNPRILQPLCGVIDFPLIQLCPRWCLEHGDRKPIALLSFNNIFTIEGDLLKESKGAKGTFNKILFYFE